MDIKKIEAMLEQVENKTEIIGLINSENGKDVQKYKLRAEKAEGEIILLKEKADELTLNLEKVAETVLENDTLKSQLQTLKEELETERANAFEQQKNTELILRFENVLGEKEFKHPIVKEAVFKEFCKKILDEDNSDKSDLVLFDLITENKDYFSSQNPTVNTGNFCCNNHLVGKNSVLRLAMGLSEENY